MRAAQAEEGFALLCLQHMRLCREAGSPGRQSWPSCPGPWSISDLGREHCLSDAWGPGAPLSGQGALSL